MFILGLGGAERMVTVVLGEGVRAGVGEGVLGRD